MTPITFAAAGIAVVLISTGLAFAGSDEYTAADIISFFAGPPDKLVTRGVCVGSDPQCPPEKPKTQASFDPRIEFDKNSAELSPDAQNKLMQFSFALRNPRLANLRFAVEGFTDASGSSLYNVGLSERRAQSVVVFLIDLGIDQSRLEARGYGASKLRGPDPFDPRNRRVETRIIQQ